MRVFNSTQRSRISWAKWLGLVCIALVLLTGIIQVTHTHATGQADREGCSLCVTAHHVVQAVALIVLAISIQLVVRVTIKVRNEIPRQRFLLKLANRPPPVAPAFA